MWYQAGWELDLESSIKEYLTTRPAIKQTIQTVMGQVQIKELFVTGQVKSDAAFLFTEAASDLVILVNKFAKKYNTPIRTVGLWRQTHVTSYRYDSFYEKRWWIDFDRACFKGLEKSFLMDEYFKYEFIHKVTKKNHMHVISKGPYPASVVKDHINSIQPVEFKTNMILFDSVDFNPEHKRMIALLLSELKFPEPVSIVFAYENGTPTREQYVKWLMNAKIVINPNVQGKVGDDVYEYYASKCIPLCNAPDFYINILPKKFRIQREWFDNIGTFIDVLPIIKDKVWKGIVNYEQIRSEIDFLDFKLETLYFSKEKFLEKLY